MPIKGIWPRVERRVLSRNGTSWSTRMGLVYQDRNELTMDGRGTGSRREACQKALAIKRWAQGPEPGQWRWQKDPLWTFVSEVNELIWWMIT